MYQFVKNLLPTKSNERKQQETKDAITETVEEAKQEVSSVEEMEFDLSLGINQTSGSLNKLEDEREKLFKSVSLIENQLKILSEATLNESQQAEKEKLEKILKERVKPSVEKMDKEIDILTKKLLDLYKKRDLLTQKKVCTEDSAEDASKINTPEQKNYIPFDTISKGNTDEVVGSTTPEV
ncbi:hypothetical protein RB653_010526 [Dictyostelium firmibasis]|uniref:Uncharacterized protein n=1 Tax=Dictyostelium firmibasis TaxID=79012 RepID=A0AAN7YL49_9MYCE